jgi:hypothetical protein
MLENMPGATNQTLQGFKQFWTPFVDGSVSHPIPKELIFTPLKF